MFESCYNNVMLLMGLICPLEYWQGQSMGVVRMFQWFWCRLGFGG
jgi:hypothetical protein